MLEQATTGTPITVIGDGKQRRAFTWVGDVVNAVLDLSNSKHANGEVVNVGNPHSTPILEVAQTIQRLTGTKSEIVYISQMDAYGCTFEEISDRLPDLTKLRRLIDFHPTLDLDEMIFKMIFKEKTVAAG
jgi:UDP-glucose 4-epimerase